MFLISIVSWVGLSGRGQCREQLWNKHSPGPPPGEAPAGPCQARQEEGSHQGMERAPQPSREPPEICFFSPDLLLPLSLKQNRLPWFHCTSGNNREKSPSLTPITPGAGCLGSRLRMPESPCHTAGRSEEDAAHEQEQVRKAAWAGLPQPPKTAPGALPSPGACRSSSDQLCSWHRHPLEVTIASSSYPKTTVIWGKCASMATKNERGQGSAVPVPSGLPSSGAGHTPADNSALTPCLLPQPVS